MEAKTFAEAWQLCAEIDGWLSRAEAAAIYNAALNVPEGRQIVEIGAYRGKSTTLLAASGRSVVTIDPLTPGPTSDNYAVSDADSDALERVVNAWPNVEWLRQPAVGVDYTGPSIGLLYIDGDHQGDAPLADFRQFEPSLADDALVAFHDFGDRPAVGRCVAELERAGRLVQVAAAGLMWIGRIGRYEAKRAHVFVARPYYDRIEPESLDSEQQMADASDRLRMRIRRHRSSLLTQAFNRSVVDCLNTGGYDWFAMLHADIAAERSWLAQLITIAERHGFDVLHAVSPIKNAEGLSSTAIAYSQDPWKTVRRLTMHELQQIRPTFGLVDINRGLDATATSLLPNTGCLLCRTNVLDDFPGFEIRSRIVLDGDRRVAEVIPEDWNFGFWCAAQGFSVGATREVTLQHFGRQAFPNNDAWGMPVDRHWQEHHKAA